MGSIHPRDPMCNGPQIDAVSERINQGQFALRARRRLRLTGWRRASKDAGIAAGKPMQNGICDACNGRIRDDLNETIFLRPRPCAIGGRQIGCLGHSPRQITSAGGCVGQGRQVATSVGALIAGKAQMLFATAPSWLLRATIVTSFQCSWSATSRLSASSDRAMRGLISQLSLPIEGFRLVLRSVRLPNVCL